MGSAESSLSSNDILPSNSNDMPAWVLIVFEFTDWRTRCNMMMTSKRWWRNTNDMKFYRFLTKRLAIEHGVYIPPVLPTNETWKTLFYEAFKLRHVWDPSDRSIPSADNEGATIPLSNARETVGERFKISVFARFRPVEKQPNVGVGNEKSEDDDGEDTIQVTLPLHQRLAMIRMSRRLKNNKQALKVLTTEGGWFQKKWTQLSADEEATPDTAGTAISALTEPAVSSQGGANVTAESGDKENCVQQNNSSSSGIGAGTANTTGTGHYQTKGGASFDAGSKVPQFLRTKYAEQQQQQRARAAAMGGKNGGVGATAAATADGSSGSGEGMVASVQTVDPMSGRVVTVAPDVGLREFSFDAVLPDRVSQRHAYNSSARRLVMDFINGFNATAIVYGQTGSGKTYSMFGHDIGGVGGVSGGANTAYFYHSEHKGIVPRACEELFAALTERATTNGIESEVSVSYVEIFGDEVSDLLRQGARCGHSKVAAQQFVLSGAAEKVVHNIEEIEAVLQQGELQKRRAATAMNDRSTRAHSLFIVSLKQNRPTTTATATSTTTTTADVTLQSRLFLADLGGSEQVKKSKVDAGANREGREGSAQEFSVGFQLAEHMREAVNINLGLLALKKCIEALNNRALYTPYQDSKLTMLLSAGLGGNSKTSVIVCANMDAAHITETVATLRFGERCALIETEARNNATMLAGVLRQLDQRIADLEAAIVAKERWEEKNEVRADELAEEGTFEKMSGAMEVKKVSVLVGAENERQQLEALLIQRAKFIGSEPIAEEGEEEDGEGQVAAGGTKAFSRKKVVGFGKEMAELYGLGGKFDENAEFEAENTRFAGAAEESALPAVVKAKKGAKIGWATGVPLEEEDAAVLERKARRIKRNRLAYSGISS
mmetsp:Transcript_25872/g.43132  ORF Transcript_25872/g.43132 Transcript_25872/m.43132 type:complete len:889 (+) Transcript_25872:106-2772(+)|eukprot:CAMPEP_0174968816 /NCGR_PEP_ID=MMETSP0004_2-20121128/8364_1 /TAXON_ID=420556 /ORGANISM="Ochromonas sp., Strain CCMP1393" /LENGTH=888 /DNA_ID=CAMNT_0016218131 /DNA_START=72 /DNA_END=2738 /DNA_ORIENTATION=+